MTENEVSPRVVHFFQLKTRTGGQDLKVPDVDAWLRCELGGWGSSRKPGTYNHCNIVVVVPCSIECWCNTSPWLIFWSRLIDKWTLDSRMILNVDRWANKSAGNDGIKCIYYFWQIKCFWKKWIVRTENFGLNSNCKWTPDLLVNPPWNCPSQQATK